MGKQNSVVEKSEELYDPHELAELRSKIAYMRYRVAKWKQNAEREGRKEEKEPR